MAPSHHQCHVSPAHHPSAKMSKFLLTINMHPVEAISILSQLAYVPSTAQVSFVSAYTYAHGFAPNVVPVAPYTPLYTNFAYASGFKFEPNTPNSDAYRYFNNNVALSSYYNAGAVGMQSAYDRTLFLMTRDLAVLERLADVKVADGYYCIRNGAPIKSALSESAFKESYNVNVVYPCTGPAHDARVPKCVCPAPVPPAALWKVRAGIQKLKAAAPFHIRLKELYAAVADAHKAAAAAEGNCPFPMGTLLANYTFEAWADLGIQKDKYDWEPRGTVASFKSNYRWLNQCVLAETSRAAADAAEATLAAYIASSETAAFSAFNPSLRPILTAARANARAGCAGPQEYVYVDLLTRHSAASSRTVSK